MKIDIPYGFSNDETLKCSECGAGFMCFSTEGSTVFCPCCGTRNMDFEIWEEEE